MPAIINGNELEQREQMRRGAIANIAVELATKLVTNPSLTEMDGNRLGQFCLDLAQTIVNFQPPALPPKTIN